MSIGRTDVDERPGVLKVEADCDSFMKGVMRCMLGVFLLKSELIFRERNLTTNIVQWIDFFLF